MRTSKYSRLRLFSVSLIAFFGISTAWAAIDFLVEISQDPYTDTASGAQHATEVSAQIASNGATIVTGFQVGRNQVIGAENVGWATSQDLGITWKRGFLSGTTTIAGGTWATTSQIRVAYNQKYNWWYLAMIGYDNTGFGIGAYVSRSRDGIDWSKPFTVATYPGADSYNFACDNSLTSPHYGNCYAVWVDDNTFIDQFSYSTDGGTTWSAPVTTPDQASGEIAAVAVQPNGHVIFAGTYGGPNFDQEYSFQSIDGGKTLQTSVNFTTVQFNYPGQGYMRGDPFPTAGSDSAGLVYITWPDCRFRTNCSGNDAVLTTTTDGTHYTAVQRVPIDAVTSGSDHFVVGLGLSDPPGFSSLLQQFFNGSQTPKLGISYYYFPNANCDINSCQLYAGFISSNDGGKTWGAPIKVAGPMSLNWLATSDAGQMVGDEGSVTYVFGVPMAAYSLAKAPNAKTGFFNQGTYFSPFIP